MTKCPGRPQPTQAAYHGGATMGTMSRPSVLWLNGVRDSGMSDYERHQWVLKDTRGLNRVKVL